MKAGNVRRFLSVARIKDALNLSKQVVASSGTHKTHTLVDHSVNKATLRKIAAATAIVMEEFGGTIDVYFLMKALYRADRRMLMDFGRTITGDRYSSMPKGPIVSETYDLVRNKFDLPEFQAIWNEAFFTTAHTIQPRGIIDLGPLSPVEEDFLRFEAREVKAKRDNGENVADWMHKTCPEWERVDKGTSKPLKVSRIVEHLNPAPSLPAAEIEARLKQGRRILDKGKFSTKPLLLSNEQ